MHFLTNDSLPWRRKQPSENANDFQVQRVVRAYEKDGDRLIDEFLLKNASLPELQKLFSESEQNSMVDSYPISIAQADYFQQRLQIILNFEALDYFLECDVV